MGQGKFTTKPIEGRVACAYGCGGDACYLLGASEIPCCSSHYNRCPGERKSILVPEGTSTLCKYGCGEKAAFFIGKRKFPCCGQAFNNCPGWKEKTCSSNLNPSLNPSIVKRRMQTFLENFGVTNPCKSQEIRDKINLTCQKKYGENSPMCSPEIIRKRTATCLDKYGVENVTQSEMMQAKTKQTCLEKYGVPFSFQAESTKRSIRETCLKRYGVENAAQNPLIHEKTMQSGMARKCFVLPSGREIRLQGYEPQALKSLLSGGFSEGDFEFDYKKHPAIWYSHLGKRRRYFPDFYFPRIKQFFEVKSNYTFTSEKDQNLAKRKACIDAGYNFNFLIRQEVTHAASA
jgi:hypothetical protein